MFSLLSFHGLIKPHDGMTQTPVLHEVARGVAPHWVFQAAPRHRGWRPTRVPWWDAQGWMRKHVSKGSVAGRGGAMQAGASAGCAAWVSPRLQ